MNQAEAESHAREGYDRMAEVYTNHVVNETTVPSLVLANLDYFAHLVTQSESAKVADVGCGPGHITAFLAGLGVDILGIDISPALLEIARDSHPEIAFEAGELASLPLESDSLQGLVSRHSLIHTPADLVPAALQEFARVLAPGGLLFLSFFATNDPADHGQAFDHAVTTAYSFDVDAMADMLSEAGLVEDVRLVRQPREGERQLPHGIFFARRA